MGVARSTRRPRRWLSVTMIAVAIVLIPLAIVTSWIELQLLSTDAYVGAVRPIVSEERAQVLLVETLTMEVGQALSKLIERPAIRPLVSAGGGYDAVIADIEFLITALIYSDQFEAIWAFANKAAHETISLVLRGEGPITEINDRDEFTINLAAAVTALNPDSLTILDDLLAMIPVDEMPEIALFHVPELPWIERYVAHSGAIAVVLSLLAVALLAGGIWFARNRLKSIVWAGSVLAVVTLAFVLLVRFSLRELFYRVQDATERELAGVYVRALLSSVEFALLGAVAMGIVIALIAQFTSRKFAPAMV